MSLGDLSVDDFMNQEWSSENSESDSEKGVVAKTKAAKTKKKPGKNTKKTVKNHQAQLDSLKEKDPEFYEFLKGEESDLLNFDLDNDEMDNSDDDESDNDAENEGSEGSEEFDVENDESSEDDDDEIHQPPTQLMENVDSDEDEEMESEDDTENVAKSEKVTLKVAAVKEWESQLDQEKPAIKVVHEVMQAFHAAIVQFGDDSVSNPNKKSKNKDKRKHIVADGAVFNEIVGLCIRKVIPCISKILNYNMKSKKSKSKEKFVLPSTLKKWKSVKFQMKVYLEDCNKLTVMLRDHTVQCTMLRHTLLLVPYYMCYPKITKSFYKDIIKLWSTSSDESVRVLAFLILNRIVKLGKKLYLKKLLKNAYLAYVANSMFTTPSTLPMINFMQRTLTELYAMDMGLTYELGFLYIRQLAIHLRQAMTQHKQEAFKAVYNWQYIHCIGLWSRVLGVLCNATLQPLIYPLVQVSLGTIDLIPTPRYFPLRFHVVRSLIMLGDMTNTYIPLFSYILKPLQLSDFLNMKPGTSVNKIKFATILKLSNSQLKEKTYRETVMDEVYELTMSYLNTQAHTIAFPEMTVPAILSIKKFAKNCKMPTYRKIMRQILDNITENSEFITKKRSLVTFGVTDFEAVDAWEKETRLSGVPFNKQQAKYNKLRERELQQEAVSDAGQYSERLPTIDRQKFLHMSKEKDRTEFKDLFKDIEEDDKNEMESDFTKALNEDENKQMSIKCEDSEEDGEEMAVDEEQDEEKTEKQTVSKTKSKRKKKAKITKDQTSNLVPDDDGEVKGSGDIVKDFQFSSDEDN